MVSSSSSSSVAERTAIAHPDDAAIQPHPPPLQLPLPLQGGMQPRRASFSMPTSPMTTMGSCHNAAIRGYHSHHSCVHYPLVEPVACEGRRLIAPKVCNSTGLSDPLLFQRMSKSPFGTAPGVVLSGRRRQFPVPRSGSMPRSSPSSLSATTTTTTTTTNCETEDGSVAEKNTALRILPKLAVPDQMAALVAAASSYPDHHLGLNQGQRPDSPRHTPSERQHLLASRLVEGLPAKASIVESRETSGQRPRPFTCSQEGCGKTFPSRSRLQRHMFVHTGLRPHSCLFPGCTRTFGRRDNMLQHYRAHVITTYPHPTSHPHPHPHSHAHPPPSLYNQHHHNHPPKGIAERVVPPMPLAETDKGQSSNDDT